MAKSQITVEDMMEAGLHFGHQTFRRNPKMNQYIFGAKEGIHIIDLTKTEPLLAKALEYVAELTAGGGQLLFVGTKRQASELVAKAAQQCNMPYVAERWLGGLLTNFETVKKRLKYMRDLDEIYEKEEFSKYTKKEKSELDKEYEKLKNSLGGLRDLKGLPAALFVADILKDKIAVQEARKLKIPVIAVVDTNTDPDLVDLPIPGNDDARKAIEYVVNMIAGNCQAQVAAKMEVKPAAKAEEKTNQQEEENAN